MTVVVRNTGYERMVVRNTGYEHMVIFVFVVGYVELHRDTNSVLSVSGS